jgi:hypothetical protein
MADTEPVSVSERPKQHVGNAEMPAAKQPFRVCGKLDGSVVPVQKTVGHSLLAYRVNPANR